MFEFYGLWFHLRKRPGQGSSYPAPNESSVGVMPWTLSARRRLKSQMNRAKGSHQTLLIRFHGGWGGDKGYGWLPLSMF
jgi:hypothetical protein